MSVTKKILTVILALALIISPFAFVTAMAFALPPQYSDTFFGALNEKYDRLSSLEGEKIVVVGGSSVAFGLDSEQLESYTGMPVVNFGLYADLGTKMMLDLSLSGISEGDLVILAPELDAQTLSLYFNNRSALMALDDDYSMLLHLSGSDIFSCLGAMYPFALDKYTRYTSDTVTTDTIYRAEYFNEYGDFALQRVENIMPYYYDPNTSVQLTPDVYGEELVEFFDYLNKYIKKCERRGATVCFSYCPINEMALSDDSNLENREAFVDMLEKNINCDFISDIDDYILEAGYFFDTNFHLNDAGVDVRTIRLAKDLRIAYGIMRGSLDSEPVAPALPNVDVFYEYADDVNVKYFTFEEMPNGAYAISGLTEEGLSATELTIPAGINNRKITAILENAFAGASVESVIIPEDSNLVIINNGAFFGASNLKGLWVHKMSARDIMPPVDFSGVHPSFVIHVPRGSAYADDYDWSNKATYVYDIEV